MSSTPIDSTIPPGGMREAIKSAARSAAEEQGVLDRTPKSAHRKALLCLKHLQISKSESSAPPYNPPRRPAHSAGPAKMDRGNRLLCDQNFDHFLTSIFVRFGVVLGRHLGSHFRLFWPPRSAKLGPKRVLKADLNQKYEFSPNTTPADTAAIFETPRWPPKCFKIDPRRLQEALGEQIFGS